jgi:hypothetical protein
LGGVLWDLMLTMYSEEEIFDVVETREGDRVVTFFVVL